MSILKRLGLLILLLGTRPGKAAAIHIPAIHFTTENGLPSNMVYSVYQDKSGFIWISTDKGIARYNGRSFEFFTTADGLSDNDCFYVKEDYNGRMWVITANGRLCYYKDGVFHNETNTPFLKLQSGASLINIFRLAPDSSIVFSLHDDPGFFEIKGERIRYFNHPLLEHEMTDTKMRAYLKTPEGNYIGYYSKCLITFDQASGTFSRHPYDTLQPTGSYSYGCNDFAFRIGNTLLTKQGQIIPQTDTSLIERKVIYMIGQEPEGLVIATNKGIIFDGKTTLLEEENIPTYTRDKYGYYWIPTLENGLYRISSSFTQQQQQQLSHIAQQRVNFAYHSGNSLLYTTIDRNIYCLDLPGRHTKQLFDYTKSTHKLSWSRNVSWVTGSNYYNCTDHENFRLSGINRMSTARISRLRLYYMPGACKKLSSGPYIFLQETHNFFRGSEKDFQGMADTVSLVRISKQHGKIYGSAADPEGRIWYSLSDRVYRIADTVSILQPQFGNISFREMIFFQQYMVGITPQNQLLITDSYEEKAPRFHSISNLNCVWDRLLPINDSVLLIATNRQFRILTTSNTGNRRSYSVRILEHPLIPGQPDYILSDSGFCYFFVKNTLRIFPVSYLLDPPPLPEIRFSFLKTSSASIFIRDTVKLRYQEAQNIRVLFTAISSGPMELSYEYSLSRGPKAGQWFPIDNEELNLTRLGYGGLSVRIRTRTSSGIYSMPSAFYLSIEKPYWATWWFICGAVLMSLLLLSGIVYLWIRVKLKKKESDIAFLKSEYKYLNALMNPHFIFNALNSVQGLVNNAQNKAASKYIRIFSDLIRQNMHNIASDQIPLEKEMQLVGNYLRMEQLRLDGALSYEVIVGEDIDLDTIPVPPLLIQPLVENAIKHGIWPNISRAGRIDINIYEEENNLCIAITDNGKGFGGKQEEQQHQSYALANLEQRLKQLSMIHGRLITVSLNERQDDNGAVLGVCALLIIHQYRKE